LAARSRRQQLFSADFDRLTSNGDSSNGKLRRHYVARCSDGRDRFCIGDKQITVTCHRERERERERERTNTGTSRAHQSNTCKERPTIGCINRLITVSYHIEHKCFIADQYRTLFTDMKGTVNKHAKYKYYEYMMAVTSVRRRLHREDE